MNVTTSTVTTATRRVVLTTAVALLGLLAVLVGHADADGADTVPEQALLAMGSTDDRIVIKTHPNDNTTVRTVQLDFAAGDSTGWHTHPGPGIVTIQSGTFTLERSSKTGCTERPLGPKDVFIDDGTAHALTAVTAGQVFVTLITPTDAGKPTVPLASAPC